MSRGCIVVDNGPEFQSRALDAWAHRCGASLGGQGDLVPLLRMRTEDL